MVANHRSVNKAKRSRDEGKRSSSGLKKKKKAKEGSGSKKAKRSCETEGSGSKEDAEMEVSESASGNGKTKMVSMRLYKKSIEFLKSHPPIKPHSFPTCNPIMQCIFASAINRYEVEWEFHDCMQRQFLTRGYAEYQVEVSDDKDK